jgi:hypothetical protein
MHESVLSMRVVTSDGAVVAVDRSHELFGRVIGGFGLFGVVTELALKTTANLKLDVELVKASAAEFPALYDKVLADGTVDVKLARVNITTSKDLQLFVFRRTSDDPTVSDLAPRANEMGLAMSLLYKWVMPLRFFQRMRYLFEVGGFCFLHAGPANEILLEYVHWTAGVKVCAAQKSHRRHGKTGSLCNCANPKNHMGLFEDAIQQPIDFSGGATDRNVLMYESAVPLAHLINDVIAVDDTFVLQEYFVPREDAGGAGGDAAAAASSLAAWLAQSRAILWTRRYEHCTLLNITVRFVRADGTTALPYAPVDSFAFVLYFRVRRSAAGDAELARIHTEVGSSDDVSLHKDRAA